MKKAAIITYWNTNDNYGTVLQNYALQTYLKEKNISSTLIREKLSSKEILKNRMKRLFSKYGLLLPIHIIKLIVKNKYSSSIEKKNIRRRQFDKFRKNISYTKKIYSNYDELCKEQNDYDLYIAGSDQIWSFQGVKNKKHDEKENFYKCRFFDFANKEAKKISCAASFGDCNFDQDEIYMIKNYLKQFDFISIREQNGVDFCKKNGIKLVFHQNDPTMLHDANFYRRLSGNRLITEKYVVLFLLNNKTDFNILKLMKWAKKNKLKVIYINGNTSYFKFNFFKKYYPTIPEWLNILDNAEYVFTNSFHGTVFSLIFNKQFMSIVQNGSFSGQNVRIYSLLTQFGIENRIFSGDFNKVLVGIDWNTINEKLDLIRNSSPFVEWINNYTTNLKENE